MTATDPTTPERQGSLRTSSARRAGEAVPALGDLADDIGCCDFLSRHRILGVVEEDHAGIGRDRNREARVS